MSIFSKAKDAYKAWALYKSIQEGGKMDFKSIAGVLKILGYVAALGGLVIGYLDPKTVIIITIAISALVKFVETIAPITPTTKDDEFIREAAVILRKNGLLK